MNVIFAKFDPHALQAARDLCADCGDTNVEYVRGCAELLIDTTPGVSMDHKEDLIAYLGAPL